jgi:hypothetical protein
MSGFAAPVGARVFCADGEELGKVIASEAHVFLVEQGVLLPADFYVPVEAIAGIDGDTVRLAVTRSDALARGWERAEANKDTWTQENYSSAVAGYDAVLSSPLDTADHQTDDGQPE